MKNQVSKTLKPVEWKEEVIPENWSQPCKHYFEIIKGTSKAECKHCRMGIMGVYELKDGKPII
jgi:hypothetical protein